MFVRWLFRGSIALALACVLAASVPSSAKDDGDVLTSLFASLDALDAYEAVEKAEADGDPAAAPRLFTAALSAQHPHLAVAVGDALRTLGSTWVETPAFGRTLKSALRSKRVEQRANLACVLGAWGLPAFDDALAKLATNKHSPRVQEETLFMAGALPVGDDVAFPAVEKAIEGALKAKAPEVRIAACAAAGRRRLKSLVPGLMKVAQRDRDRWVAQYAVRALERIDEPVDLASFATALRRKPKPPIRAAALKAVATLPRVVDLPTLLRLLRDRDGEVRCAALAGVQQVVAPMLFTVDPEARTPLDSADPKVVETLTDVLVDLAFEAEAGWRRSAAIDALGRMRAAVPRVMHGRIANKLDDPREGHVLVAIKLCARLGIEEAYPRVLEIARTSQDVTLHTAAARALEMLDAQLACKDLLSGIQPYERTSAAVGRAIDALGYVRHLDAVQGCIDLLAQDGWGEEGLRAVETSLERLTGHRFGPDAAAWKLWLAKAEQPFPAPMAITGPRERRAAARKEGAHGFRPEFDRTMEAGLAWLERRQHGCGCWAGAEDGLGHVVDFHAPYTAEALLAFTGAGYGPDVGRFRELIWRAAEFVAATQRFDGRVAGAVPDRYRLDDLGEWNTLHVSLGTWSLVEMNAVGEGTARRGAAQRALDYASHTALPGRGWGAFQTDEERTGSSALLLIATGFGRAGGLDVDRWAPDGADLRLRLCATDMWGTRENLEDRSVAYDYEVGKEDDFYAHAKELPMSASEQRDLGRLPTLCLNELALLARLFAGWERSHPAARGWARRLREDLPIWRKGDPGPTRNFPHTHWWLASWALFQMGGPGWRNWGERLGRMLCDHQRLGESELHGSWDPDKTRTRRGRLHATCMALYALQSWYRFPPRLIRP